MTATTFDVEEIPDELKERDQWLLWTTDPDQPKRPHWRGNFRVSWTNPDHWHSFEEAVEAAKENEKWGIGYCFANTTDDHPAGIYGALDLDGCADEDGRPKDWLPSLQAFFDAGAYMEFSPSGQGIHIPLVGFEPPEWWSDVWFTDEEHEGVEAYGKKFFTFTGDRLQGAGDEVADTGEFVEDWLIEAHKGVTGEDPTKERSADFTDVSDGGRANREEFLDEDDIRDALDHVNPDVEYNTWRDIGFALSDFFSSDHTALSVFEDWSRGGSKWDSDAEKQAERIISDASGGGRTIGTVIHHARAGGWQMPTPSKTSRNHPPKPPKTPEDGDDESTDDNQEWEISWDYVREMYADEGNEWGRYYAAEAIDTRYSWMYVMESETLWVYDEDSGYFNPWGEERVANILERELASNYSRAEKEEVTARLQARHQTHREDLNARSLDDPLVCVGNGVVNIRTGELLDHSPDYRFTRGLSHDWNPDAVPERTLRFLRSVTKRDADMRTLVQHLGHGLMSGHPYKAFIVMFGPGDNGKSAVGAVFRHLVGDENAAGVELRDFDDDSFATGDLPGKMLNIGDDLSGKKIKDASMLKRLTSNDDTVRANEKYEKTFDFQNEAAMFFSGNEPPKFAEQTEALKGRLYPIHMPYRFTQEDDEHQDADPQLVQKIVSDPEEMSGLLALAVQGAQELIESGGHFAMPEGPEERMRMYEAASDPIRRFVMDCLEQGGPEDVALKDDVYDVYAAMCRAENEQTTAAHIFKSEVSSQAIIDVEKSRTRLLTDGEEQETCWKYLRFGPEARQYMSDRLESRYFSEEEDGSSDDDGDSNDGEESASNPWNASPVADVARDPTGYGTVTVEVLTVEHADSENAPSWRATVKDETSAIDVVSWDDPDAPEEGDVLVIENAEIGEYNGKTQLTVRPGVTEFTSIQQGVGYTEGVKPDENQGQLDASAQPEAEADGGRVTADADETTGSVPDDAEGMLADARRLVDLLEQRGVPLEENEIVVTASIDRDLMDPERAKAALEYAVEEKGLIMETGDGYIPT